MARLVLHVGLPKTATTFLQRSFDMNRADLHERGVAYPETFTRPGIPAHHDLGFLLGHAVGHRHGAPPLGLSDGLDQIFEQGADTVVLSSERLSFIDDESWERLQQALGGRVDVTAVIFLRRWSELLFAWWTQTVKSRVAVGLPEYTIRQLPFMIDLFQTTIWRLRRHMGPTGVQIVLLDNLGELDPFEYFCREVLGSDAPPARPSAGESNIGGGFAVAEAMRLVQQARADVASAGEGGAPGPTPTLRVDDESIQEIAAEIGRNFTEGEGLDLRCVDRLLGLQGSLLKKNHAECILNPHDGGALFAKSAPGWDSARKVEYVDTSRLPRVHELARVRSMPPVASPPTPEPTPSRPRRILRAIVS